MQITKSNSGPVSSSTFLLGIPSVSDGPILKTARNLAAPVLVSANALSIRKDQDGYKQWERFRTSTLSLLTGMDAYLDSGGFVAASLYGGFDWTISQYIDLVAAHPWRWAAALDYCVEPEIASSKTIVRDRISQTVGSLRECLRYAEHRGVQDRILPVVQGWETDDYARCLDRMPDLSRFETIGVGSVCRRHVHGPNGILAVLDRIDYELGDLPVRIHLFGVKGDALPLIATHPRVASFDSQAYGIRARVLAREGKFSKTSVFVASVMQTWYEKQITAIERSLAKTRLSSIPDQASFSFDDPSTFESRFETARDQMRVLLEQGEIDHSDINDARVLEWMFDSDVSENGVQP